MASDHKAAAEQQVIKRILRDTNWEESRNFQLLHCLQFQHSSCKNGRENTQGTSIAWWLCLG